ncbi:DNA-binding IclR family transcriptional regulator [Rhodoligotrophos appendicifer]|uniref:IclR family transcriptional regulator n=1 Tax=Rhodoligotrophos appendicifer TaxID=987056 RepID=UPI001185AB75|nr:IclR family transcriptional regulator [Rhodoligotrophos appendicifer]
MGKQSAKSAKKEAVTSSKSGENGQFVDAVVRGMRLLEAFSATPRPMSLSELAKAAGFDKSAAQRLTRTLVGLGYLEKTAGGVVPGRRILERSFDYLRAHPLVSRAVPILADLRRTVNERVDLSLFDDTSMIYIVRMQSKRDTFYAHLIGARVPTYCTSGGRAVLSHLTPEHAMDIIERSDRSKLTPRTTTEVKDILQRIAEIRETGYSLALEEVVVGEVAVGAAILDANGFPIAALHVVGSLAEWAPQDFVQRVGPLVTAAANGLRAP